VREQPAQERCCLQRVADAPAGPWAEAIGEAPEGDGDQGLRRHADGEAEAGLGHGEPDDLDGVDGLAGDERAGAEREYRALDRCRPDQRVVGEDAVKESAQPPGVGRRRMRPLCRFLCQFLPNTVPGPACDRDRLFRPPRVFGCREDDPGYDQSTSTDELGFS
jgi:hypothetical protein